jgi:tRNA(adenine34) deaminase
MKEALREANKAYSVGEVPIGAVIVKDGKIIARGYNKKESSKRAIAHAEIIAIERACKKTGDWRLSGCELYVTVEPCLMCCGAILQSRIKKLIYGAKNAKFGCVESVEAVLTNEKQNHSVEIIAGVCEKEATELVQSFFKNNRQMKG